MILWAVAATAAAEDAVRLAVVVSANEGLPHEVDLKYADQDARRVANVLHEIGRFAPGDVWVVSSAEVDDVFSTLSRVTARAHEIVTDGGVVTLFVFYAGHAGTDGLHLSGETLSLQAFKAAIRVVPARDRIVVLDACHAGSIARSRGATVVDVSDTPPGFVPPDDEAWIASSGPEERSFEVEERRGALFTLYFLSGARGAADADADHMVTLGELYGFVKSQTSAAAAGLGEVQQPTWAGDLAAFPLTDLRRSPTGVRVVGPIADPLLLIGKTTPSVVVAEVPSGSAANVALPPGEYQVVSSPGDAAVSVGHLSIPHDGWTLWEPRSELGRVSSVRTRGGLYEETPWYVGAGYALQLGVAEGRPDAHGASLAVGRAIGRGHALEIAAGFSSMGFDTSFWEGTDTIADLRLRWTREIAGRRVTFAPGALLMGGWLRHELTRDEHPVWGEWYGDKTGSDVESGLLVGTEAGVATRIPFGRTWATEVWLGGGAVVHTTPAIELSPTASGRVLVVGQFR